MTTYQFTAYTEASLLEGTGDTNISTGDVFTIPHNATAQFTVYDDDAYLSGDSVNNENADDHSGQTANITDASGAELGNGGQIYAESYWWVSDQYGNWYVMVEIEQEGSGDDYFAFYNSSGYCTPAEGAVLTVDSSCNVTSEWIQYCTLDGNEMPPDLGSLGGRVFTDSDGDNTEWNSQTNSWENGEGGLTVTLYMWDGTTCVEVATTTTDSYGTYSFGDLSGGWYYVKFTKPDGTEFVAQDVGDDGADSDANSGGYTDWIWLGAGEDKWNVDAGVSAPPAVDAVDDKITVTESETAGDIETLDSGETSILANDTNDGGSYSGQVVEVNGVTGNVGQWIELDKGRVMINADGTVDFDADGDFEALNDGESETVSVTYTILGGRTTTVEAEDLSLNGFHIVHGDQASGGELIKANCPTSTATLYDFSGASGAYDISLFFQDETDGQTLVRVTVNGQLVGEFQLDRDSDGVGSDNGAFSQFTLNGIELSQHDDIVIETQKDGGEWSRLDKVEFTRLEASDTATVTIEVLGETDFVLDAVDDFYSVNEDEAAGDTEGNVLDNDINN